MNGCPRMVAMLIVFLFVDQRQAHNLFIAIALQMSIAAIVWGEQLSLQCARSTSMTCSCVRLRWKYSLNANSCHALCVIRYRSIPWVITASCIAIDRRISALRGTKVEVQTYKQQCRVCMVTLLPQLCFSVVSTYLKTSRSWSKLHSRFT